MKPLPHKPKLLNLAIAGLVMSGAPLTDAFAREWICDGDGGDDSWFYSYYDNSPLTNWQDNTSGPFILPADGDSLTFSGNARLTPLNDGPAGLVVNGLKFDSTAGQFTLNGSAITSTSNITNNSNNLQTINMPITVGSNQTWDGGTQGMTINGNIGTVSHTLTLSNHVHINNATQTISFANADTIFFYTPSVLQTGSSLLSAEGVVGDVHLGQVNLLGAGTSWQNTGNLTIGKNGGSGTLSIFQGAQVSNTDSYLSSTDQSNASGSVLVHGFGSQWINRGKLDLGTTGFGSLDIQNGGSVTVGGALNIGNNGILNLAGGSLSINAASYSNTGKFNWSSGVLHFTDPDGVTLGNPILTSAISNLTAGKTLEVDHTLTIDNGNSLSLNGGQVKADILALSGDAVAGTALDMGGIRLLKGHGTVASDIIGGTPSNIIQASGGNLNLGTLDSTSGFEFGGRLIIGNNQVSLLDKDKAHLGISTTLTNGGKLSSINGAELSNGETLIYSGNTSILGNFTNNGEITRFADNITTGGTVYGFGGTLTFLNDVNGAGSFSGDIVFHAAYNPGNSPAAIDFNGGNATYDSSSVLTIEIFGNSPGSEYDQLLNIDHLNFNGTLALVFGNHFTPTAGSSFNLFGFNQFSGSFAPDRITVTGLDRSLLDFSSLASNGKLQVAAVPLPSAAWLFFSALTGMGGLRCRPAARKSPTTN